MTIQFIIVAVAISIAAIYVLWTIIRTWTGRKTNCGSGCGKCAAPAEEKSGRVSLL